MGPLEGTRIIEVASIGPGPMSAMLLADLGATVIRVERMEESGLGVKKPKRFETVLRNRHTVAADLKDSAARDWLLRLVAKADAVLEGFRPGVMERLGLGPAPCLAANPALVYGRMTGWGQTGPLALSAGHDLNYIGITGALHAIGRAGAAPTPPLNLVGDYGGGALYLAVGVLSALLAAKRTGHGQVVDAAIVDGTASMMTPFYGLRAAGMQTDERGANILDSGRYYYDVYECADGRWISVAPIEAKFRKEFLAALGIAVAEEAAGYEESPALRSAIAGRLREQPLAHWCALLENTDACVFPVLSMEEAPRHHHLAARGTFIEVDGVTQPAPAPRFSRTQPAQPVPPHARVLTMEEAELLW